MLVSARRPISPPAHVDPGEIRGEIMPVILGYGMGMVFSKLRSISPPYQPASMRVLPTLMPIVYQVQCGMPGIWMQTKCLVQINASRLPVYCRQSVYSIESLAGSHRSHPLTSPSYRGAFEVEHQRSEAQSEEYESDECRSPMKSKVGIHSHRSQRQEC